MTNAVVINDKRELSSGTQMSLGLFAILGGINFFFPGWEAIYTFAIVIVSSAFYFIYYIFASGEFKNILAGIFISALIMALAVIPVLGWIILILFVLYNISKALDGIKNLFPEACFSLLFYGLLASKQALELEFIGSIIAFIVYIIAAYNYHVRIAQFELDTRATFYRASIMFLSVPLIAVLIVSIVSALRNIFAMTTHTRNVTIQTPQQVSGYTNSYGTEVASYTRNISSTVTEHVTQITVGSGALSSSMVRSLSESLDKQEIDPINLPLKTISPPKLALIESNTTMSDSLAHEDFLKAHIPETNKEHSFYRFDELNEKKINNFIQAIKKFEDFPKISKDDVIAYFDETLFGKGDNGVVITKQFLIAHPGLSYPSFYISLQEIHNLTVSSKLNTTIKFTDSDQNEYELVLTQSNDGAKKLINTIELIN